MNQYECVCFIVQHGMAKRIIKQAHKRGFQGGTVFYGKGTLKKFWLDILELDRYEREIIVFLADGDKAKAFAREIDNEIKFCKPGHGIAFCVPLKNDPCREHENITETEERGEHMYDIMTVIVNKGDAEDVLDAAQLAGAKGGTIINARGAGKEKTNRVFNIDIEAEKEILLMLIDKKFTDTVFNAIIQRVEKKDLKESTIYIQEASRAYGLYEE